MLKPVHYSPPPSATSRDGSYSLKKLQRSVRALSMPRGLGDSPLWAHQERDSLVPRTLPYGEYVLRRYSPTPPPSRGRHRDRGSLSTSASLPAIGAPIDRLVDRLRVRTVNLEEENARLAEEVAEWKSAQSARSKASSSPGARSRA